jgi:hypothetical protein
MNPFKTIMVRWDDHVAIMEALSMIGFDSTCVPGDPPSAVLPPKYEKAKIGVYVSPRSPWRLDELNTLVPLSERMCEDKPESWRDRESML